MAVNQPQEEQAPAPEAKPKAKGKSLVWLAVGLIVLAAAAGAGLGLAGALRPAQAAASGTGPELPENPPASPEPPVAPEEFDYVELPAMNVTLNSTRPLLLRIELVLKVHPADNDALKSRLDRCSHEVVNRIRTYFANLTPEQIRGSASYSRVRREVRNHINDELWPGGDGKIVEVLFKDWMPH